MKKKLRFYQNNKTHLILSFMLCVLLLWCALVGFLSKLLYVLDWCHVLGLIIWATCCCWVCGFCLYPSHGQSQWLWNLCLGIQISMLCFLRWTSMAGDDEAFWQVWKGTRSCRQASINLSWESLSHWVCYPVQDAGCLVRRELARQCSVLA